MNKADELNRAIEHAEWSVGFVHLLVDGHRQISSKTADIEANEGKLLKRLAQAEGDLERLKAEARDDKRGLCV